MEMRGNTARINVTLNAGSYHCLYGSWEGTAGASDAVDATEPNRTYNYSLHTLPKLTSSVDSANLLRLFGDSDIWMVECYEPRFFYFRF